MDEQFITCPKCGEKIPLSEALTQQIADGLRQTISAEYSQKFTDEKAKIEQKAEKKAAERLALELKDRDEQIKEKSALLEAAQDAEIDLRRKTREIEERERNLKLELQRELDQQREAIRKETEQKVSEEHRLSDREKDEKMAAMLRQIEDLKQRAEQGSQQAQGEVYELELEDLLRKKFPLDEIEPVPKGMRGADVIQTVCNPLGQPCGKIIWESKRTKNWANDWTAKLKDDQRAVRADVAVLTSTAFPSDAEGICEYDGVWLTDFPSCIGLASALRQGLIELTHSRCAQEGKSGKMEMIYEYISGAEFRQRIEAIVEPFMDMRNDLHREQEAMRRLWAKREKQIERVLLGASGMYGDLEGIVGAQLPGMQVLELPANELEAAEIEEDGLF
ncbi:MAG: DUF2130 domain-containing protein [Actinobacteria bacterium]|nr:DUF2130 domain-containing protein [Actinomycetota bacterium]